LSIDMADWKGVPFRARLASAERLSDAAIRRGLLSLKTPFSSASAWLSRVTRLDQRILNAVFASYVLDGDE
jgi:hypothetical protein